MNVNSLIGRPDEVRVTIAIVDSPGSVATETFSMRAAPLGSSAIAVEADVLAVLSAATRDLERPNYPPRSSNLELRRSSLDWGGSHALLEVLLEVADAASDAAVGALTLKALTTVFSSLGQLMQGEPRTRSRDEAVEYAQFQVAVGFEEIASDLRLIKVEHSSVTDSWIVELGGCNGLYEVELGWVKGLPSTVRTRFQAH